MGRNAGGNRSGAGTRQVFPSARGKGAIAKGERQRRVDEYGWRGRGPRARGPSGTGVIAKGERQRLVDEWGWGRRTSR